MPIMSVDTAGGAEDKEQNCAYLDGDDDGIRAGRFPYAAHQQPSEQHHHEKRWQVEPGASGFAFDENPVA